MQALVLCLSVWRLRYGSFITSPQFSQMRDPSSIHPPQRSSWGKGSEDWLLHSTLFREVFYLFSVPPSSFSPSLWGRNLIRGKYHQSWWMLATTTPPTCCLLLCSMPGRSMQTHSVYATPWLHFSSMGPIEGVGGLSREEDWSLYLL